MRLPWPFRRESQERLLTSGSMLNSPSRRSGRGGWKELPVLSQTVADAPLVAGGELFRSGLSGVHMPDGILMPLGHDRTADGPAGLVMGFANPTVARITVPEPATAPTPFLTLLRHRLLQHTMRREPLTTATAPLHGVDLIPEAPAMPRARVIPTVEPTRVDAVTHSLVRVRPESVGVTFQREALNLPKMASSDSRRDQHDAIDAAIPGHVTPMASGGSESPALPMGRSPEPPVAEPSIPSATTVRSLQRTPGGSRRVRLGPPIQLLTGSSPDQPANAMPLPSPRIHSQQTRVASDMPLQRSPALQPAVAAPSSLQRLTLSLERPPGRPQQPPEAESTIGSTPTGRPTESGRTQGGPDALPNASPPLVQRTASSAAVSKVTVARTPPRAEHAVGWPAAEPHLDSPLRAIHMPRTTLQVPVVRNAEPPLAIARLANVTDFPVEQRPSTEFHEQMGSHTGVSVSSLVRNGAEPVMRTDFPDHQGQEALGSQVLRPGTTAGRWSGSNADQAAWSRNDRLRLVQRAVSAHDSLHGAEPAQETTGSDGPGRRASVQLTSASTPSTDTGQTSIPIVTQRADVDSVQSASTPPVTSVDSGLGSSGPGLAAMGERETEELLRKLYPKLRLSLTRELLVARERAGSLADAG